jgi:hypothetical protein
MVTCPEVRRISIGSRVNLGHSSCWDADFFDEFWWFGGAESEETYEMGFQRVAGNCRFVSALYKQHENLSSQGKFTTLHISTVVADDH